jgi:hypothetical protein
MPDGEDPEGLAFSVARIEKPRRKVAVREQFQAGARICRPTAVREKHRDS